MRRFYPIAALTLALLCPAIVHGQNAGERAQKARQKLDQVRAKIEQVENAIKAGREHHEALADKLAKAAHAVRQTRQRLNALDGKVESLKQQVAQLQQKRDAEAAHLGDELDRLRAQVRAAYRTGQTSKLRVLLSEQNPSQVGRMLVYYEYFTQAQSKQVAKLRDKLAVLAKRQSALQARQQQLAARQHERSATLARLQSERVKQKTALDALEQQLASRKASLQDYRAAASRLQDLIGSLQRKLQEAPATTPGAFTALKGHMQPPVGGSVIAHFGDSKANGLMHWQGQWRAAPKGDPVHAVAAGRVVYVGYMHHYGLIVVLEHAGTYFTVYGHTLSSYVEIGDHVSRNEVIARAGKSGGHRRSGVYFEIRKGEQALDPSRWLTQQ